MLNRNQESNELFEELSQAAIASNTRIAYEKAWKSFEFYCSESGIDASAATPEDVGNFLLKISYSPSPYSGKLLSTSTISLYLSGINHKFVEFGKLPPSQYPSVRNLVRGLRRIKPHVSRQVSALRNEHIIDILKICDKSAHIHSKKSISLRDAALISIGFAAALRRSEICNLEVSDLEFVNSDGTPCSRHSDCSFMFMKIKKSKTDQFGTGHRIPILNGKFIEPITRLRCWLTESKIEDGYVFQTMFRGGRIRGRPLHHSDVARLVKHYAKIIGLNPNNFAGHSLRSGFVTSAAANNARLDKIMEITRHKNPSTVMKYIRDADSFNNHAGSNFL